MILQLDNVAQVGAGTVRAQQTGLHAWHYVGDVAEIRCAGWYVYGEWGPLAEVAQIRVVGAIPSTEHERAGGYMHEVEMRDGTSRWYWLNVPEAYLLNEQGDTVCKVQTGGGIVGVPGTPAWPMDDQR